MRDYFIMVYVFINRLTRFSVAVVNAFNLAVFTHDGESGDAGDRSLQPDAIHRSPQKRRIDDDDEHFYEDDDGDIT